MQKYKREDVQNIYELKITYIGPEKTIMMF